MTGASQDPPAPSWPTRRVFLLFLGFFGLYAAVRGPLAGGDTSGYMLWADRLVASGYDYPAMVKLHGDPLAITYALFVTLVAALRLAFGSGWAIGLVLLNVLAMAGVGALLSRLAVEVSARRSAGWAACFLFLACYDAWQWAPYLLSDSVFLLFAFCVFRMEAGRLLSGGGRWLPVFGASAAASLFRPTGIVLFPVTAWSFLLARTRGGTAGRRAALVLLLAGLCAGAMLFGWIMAAPERWPLGLASHAIRTIAATYDKGMVVWDRVETYHSPPARLSDYWAITADRLRWFFALGASSLSARHWAAQAIFFVPAYGLATAFVWSLLTGRSRLPKPAQDVGFAAAGALLLYAFFHAMVQVDYDWRYRIPVLPHLILLAACGFADLTPRLRAAWRPEGS